MTEPKTIKVDAAAKCEICGGEPYAMVRRPQLTMDVNRKPTTAPQSTLLCERHFQKFTDGRLNTKADTPKLGWIIGIVIMFGAVAFVYYQMSK